MPNWPISVGSAPPATAAAALASGLAASGFAGTGLAAGAGAALAAFDDALCAWARLAAPHTTPIATRAVRNRRTDITESGSLNIVTGRWLRHRLVTRAMDNREMPFWEGSHERSRTLSRTLKLWFVPR